ncbi:hypothetical protein [Pedobacter sp. JY14-1]|uniref:hypothetical protein n=1 Tax=Pedobacter sp. JY14-1 TaxID=3034151 RepID=UPI0023E202AD|nr:hypothetical protein [Pedobacter sp. JY14-1]
MSFLSAVINKVPDELLMEELQERVDIVQHKIRFMERVPLALLDARNIPVNGLEWLAEAVGAELQPDPLAARVVVYLEEGAGLLQLMGTVPSLLREEWPAVIYDRVYLWEGLTAGADGTVAAVEDLAEMLYPGQFVFGNEGKTWSDFKTR